MKNKTQNKLEILIVDDREENRNAAKVALENKANIDFAVNYEDGLNKIQNKIYAFGIFDVEMPKDDKEDTTGCYGYVLGKEAKNYALISVLITARHGHYGGNSAFVNYSDHLEPKCFEEVMETKNSPIVWERVYNTLMKNTPNINEIVASKERYKKFVGKLSNQKPEGNTKEVN